MDHPPFAPIATFRDAVGFAMELSDHYAFVTAAALLGADGHLIDLAVLDGIGGSIEPVVAWASGAQRWVVAPRSTLLVSVRPVDPTWSARPTSGASASPTGR